MSMKFCLCSDSGHIEDKNKKQPVPAFFFSFSGWCECSHIGGRLWFEPLILTRFNVINL